MPQNPTVLGNDQNNGTNISPGPTLRAQLPNQQWTIISITPGTTLREALTKALKFRKLEPKMCTVFRLSTKQQIDWDVEVSMLKGDEIVVETKDKVPMHTQLSHKFDAIYTLSRCTICEKTLIAGIRCLICGIEFHRKHCSTFVPKLCEPSNNNYYRHLLARRDGFSPTNAPSTLDSPTTFSLPRRARARSADENSKHKSKSHSGNNNSNGGHNPNDHSGRNHHGNNSGSTNINNNSTANGLTNAMTPTLTSVNFSNHVQPRNHHQVFEERWEIDGDEITRDYKIGQGSFATVYKGEWHGPVALKELNVKNPTPAQLQDFINEVVVMKKIRHPNVLLFIGYVLRPQLIIVTQWCRGRSLYKHLHVEQTRTFTNCEIKDIAFSVALGMEYLHSKNIIHRDLKSNNIFIHDEKNLTVKIGDFGLATLKTRYEGSEQIYHPTGSILWMAPEVIRTKPGVNPFTFKSDVYSYGIVLYELLSRRLPYFDFKHKDALLFLIGLGDPKLSPKLNLDVIPTDIPEGLKTLMLKCTERDVDKRPSFADIMRDFRNIRLPKDQIPKSKSEPLLLNNIDSIFQQFSIMN